MIIVCTKINKWYKKNIKFDIGIISGIILKEKCK